MLLIEMELQRVSIRFQEKHQLWKVVSKAQEIARGKLKQFQVIKQEPSLQNNHKNYTQALI